MSSIIFIIVIIIPLIYLLFFSGNYKGILTCFLRAFGLSIPTFMGIILCIIEFYRFFIISLIALFAQVQDVNVNFVFLASILFFLLAFVIYFGIIGIYLIFLKILWKNPPKFIKPRNWKTIFLGFAVSVVATFPVFIIYGPLLHSISYNSTFTNTFIKSFSNTLIRSGDDLNDALGVIFLVWFFYALGYYHILYRLENWLASKLKVKGKS